MAVDPKTLKSLNAAVKLLTSTGTNITDKARELMTVLYAINEGFIRTEEQLSSTLDELSSGKFERRNLKKYLQSLELTDDVIEDILAKRKQIDKLDERRIGNAKTYQKLLDLVYDTEDDKYNLANKTLSLFDQLNERVINQRRLLESTGVSMADQVDLVHRQLKVRGKMVQLFDSELLDAKELEDHYATINDVIDNITATEFKIKGFGEVSPDEAIVNLRTISEAQLKLIEQEDEIRRAKITEFAAWASNKRIDLKTGEIFNIEGVQLFGAALNSSNKVIQSMTAKYESLIDYVAKFGALSDAVKSTLTDTEYIFIKQAATARQELSIWQTRLDISQQNFKLLGKFRPVLLGAKAAGDGLVNSFQAVAEFIPQGVRGIFGIDESISGVRKANEEAIRVFSRSLAKTGSISESISLSFGSWSKSISGVISPLGIIAVAVAGLYTLARSLGSEYREMSETMGISTKQAKDLYAANLDILNLKQNEFVTNKELLAIQKEQVGSMGITFDLMTDKGAKTSIALAEIGKAFGYGSDEAKKLNSIFERLGADTDLALKLQTELGFMSEMAGMSPHIIAKDLAENAEIVATYFAGMPEAAARTVLQVRRLGMSLEKAGSLAQRMLDLEGFMTDMFELAAMGGPDFSKAFEFGITGDIENMTESVMDSIGSLERFNQMDFLTRQKIAKTLGMSTAEVAKSLDIRKKLSELGKDERAFVEANLDDFGDIRNMDMAAIKNRISEVDATQRLDAAWSKIKASLIKGILPAVEAIASAIDGLAPVIDFVVGIFQGLGLVIQGISQALKVLLWPLSKIGELVDWISEKFFGVEDSVNKANTAVAGMSGGLSDLGKIFGTVLGSVFAFKMFGGFLSGITGKVQTLGKILTSLPKGGILQTIMGKTPVTDTIADTVKQATSAPSGGGLMQKIFGPKTIPQSEVVVPTPKVVEKPTLPVSTKAVGKSELPVPTKEVGQLNTMSDTVSKIVKNIQSAIRGLGSVLKTVFKEISGVVRAGISEVKLILKDLITFVADTVSLAAKKIIGIGKAIFDGLSSIVRSGAKLVLDILKEAGSAVSSVLQSIGKSVGVVIKSILTGIGDGLESFGPRAIKGAAAMLILSGALWVTSKAMQAFSEVSWSDVLKGLVSIGALAGVAMVLGSASGQMILGSVAIAILGAALIPAAYALQMFSDVEWESIAKGAVSLLAFAGIAAVMGTFAPMLILGSVAMALLGAALIPTAYALQMFSDIDWATISTAIVAIGGLSAVAAMMSVVAAPMLLGAVALAAVGAALIPLAFGLDQISKIKWDSLDAAPGAILKLGGVAAALGIVSPLLVASSVGLLTFGAAAVMFSNGIQSISNLDFTVLSEIGGELTKLALSLTGFAALAPVLLVSSGAIAIFGAALVPLAVGVSMLSGLDVFNLTSNFEVLSNSIFSLGKVAAAFGVIAPVVVAGSIALTTLGVAMTTAAYGFNALSSIDWGLLDGTAMSLLKIGTAASILGVIAPVVVAGSIALTTLGVAMTTAAYGLNALSSIDWGLLDSAAMSILKIGTAVTVLGVISPLLIAGSIALATLGAAMVTASYGFNALSAIDWGLLDSAAMSILKIGTAVTVLGVISPLLIAGSIGLMTFGAATGMVVFGMNMLSSVDWGILLDIGDKLSIFISKVSAFGSSSPELLAGAVALSILGVALIPFATAVRYLSELDYSGIESNVVILGKSINELGKSVISLGAMSPVIAVGSAALLALGGAISFFGASASMALTSFDVFTNALIKLGTIQANQFSDIGTGLTQIGLGIAALGAGSLVTGISKFLGSDPFKKLAELAEIADPLAIAARAVEVLGESITKLSDAIQKADLSKLSELNALKGIASQVGVGYQMRREVSQQQSGEPSPIMTAQNVSVAEPLAPPAQMTAQDVSIRETSSPAEQSSAPESSFDSLFSDSNFGSGTKRIEALLTQLIRTIQETNNRPLAFQFDDGTVRVLRNKSRALNNNR